MPPAQRWLHLPVCLLPVDRPWVQGGELPLQQAHPGVVRAQPPPAGSQSSSQAPQLQPAPAAASPPASARAPVVQLPAVPGQRFGFPGLPPFPRPLQLPLPQLQAQPTPGLQMHQAMAQLARPAQPAAGCQQAWGSQREPRLHRAPAAAEASGLNPDLPTWGSRGQRYGQRSGSGA